MIRRVALALVAPLAAMAAFLSPALLVVPFGLAFALFALSAPLISAFFALRI